MLMLFAKIIKSCTCLSKLQLAKVGAFFSETVYYQIALNTYDIDRIFQKCH